MNTLEKEKKIPVGIIGATGYAGVELAALINKHPNFELTALASHGSAHTTLGSHYPQLEAELGNQELCTVSELLAQDLALVFLAVPHTTALETVAQLRAKNVRVVDLSADYRLKDSAVYQAYYGVSHTHPHLLMQAVYGLTEWSRSRVAEAGLVANPGCYPTASALACLPACSAKIVDLNQTIVVSAVSGFSGAGKKACDSKGYALTDENVTSYKPLVHQHVPEIKQTIQDIAQTATLNLAFTPHIASYKRGIFASCFIPLKDEVTEQTIKTVYREAYAGEPFIELLPYGEMPHITQVVGTNKAYIGCAFDADSHQLYVACAIDNLVKGAAGQALQNANVMFGLEETTGLKTKAEVI